MQPSPNSAFRPLGCLMAGAYLMLAFGWMILCGVGIAMAVLAYMVAMFGPDVLADNPDITTLIGPGITGLGAIIQSGGLALLAVPLLLLVAPGVRRIEVPHGVELWPRLRHHFAIRFPPFSWLMAAGLSAFVVGFPSGWIASMLMKYAPWLSFGSLDMISDYLGPNSEVTVGVVVLWVAIVFSAPVFEELVFRGFLWSMFEATGGTFLAFITTTLLFALFHGDPIHVIALLPTALFLGLLRWRSGSIFPGILAHFINNALAAVLSRIGPDAVNDPPFWAVAIAGALAMLPILIALALGPKPAQAPAN